jgi:chromosome segregation ATPase
MADEMTVLRDRQDRLEGRVTVLEASVEREAVLRAQMDEDQSNITQTLKAHTRSLQALHDTQQDHTRRLTGIEGRLTNVEVRLGNVEDDLRDVKVELGDVKIGVHAILDLLNAHLARKPRVRLTGLRRRARPQDDRASGR